MNDFEDKSAKRAARRCFPRRLTAQTHFIAGWKAERGETDIQLTGSYAEQSGRAAAKDFRQLTTFN